MTKLNVAGKVIIVTGASDGIGRELALQLGARGAIVVLTARREHVLEEVATRIRAAGGQGLVVPADLCDANLIAHLVERTVQEFGRIDVLINVAGMGFYDWIEEMSSDELQRQYQTNVIGLADLIRQVVPIMKQQRSGHIINFSSYASRIAVPPLTIYASTKYAIEGLSDALRRELAPWGIRVTRVHPWAVDTKFNEKAARHSGIIFPDERGAPVVAITEVTRETVAKRVIAAIERPRRAVYVSKWRIVIEMVMLINHFLPGVVDLAVRSSVKRIWRTHDEHDLQAHATGASHEETGLRKS
ncbi:MAG TPA: SDR family NAD(P)-dependent oxidoreductase [Anaerolineae bacterium]|nr:SDR family NAD(P)-dependent oxidoreductase [Anaerolineae bacterium]